MKKIFSENKTYFFVFSILSFFFIFFNFFKNEFINLELFFYSVILIFIILVFVFYFIILKEVKFYQFNVIFNLYFLVSFLIFLYFFDYIFTEIYPYFAGTIKLLTLEEFLSYSKKATIILILTILFLNLGFLTSSLILKKKKYDLLPNLTNIEFLRLNFFLFLIKLIFILLNVNFNIRIPQIENPLSILIALISFYCLFFYKKDKFLNFIIISFIFVENIFTTLALFKNLIILLIFFIIVFNIKNKISVSILILLFSWTIFGQSVKNNVRIVLANYYNLGDTIVYGGEIQETSESFIEGRPIILRSIEPILSLIRVVEFDTKGKLEKKDTLSILKYSFIPRLIFPDKPKQNYAAWYTDYFFDLYDDPKFSENYVTYNISWVTDLYLNQKYLGSTLLSFLLGFFLCIFLILFVNSNLNNLSFLFGLSVFSGISIPDYNISLMLSPLFLQFLFLIIILKIILKIIRK